MSYIDGYLIPVPETKREAYRDMAQFAAAVFIDHGAIEVVEAWGDDMMRGHTTDFFMAVKADPRFAEMDGSGLFDGKRMIFSGFVPLVDHRP